MTKRDKSKVSKIHLTENLRKKKQENYIKATEGMYSAKDFLGNLSRSMGQEPDSLYPETPEKIFRINDLVDLRLINSKTYIYINDKRFFQCFNLLFNVEGDKDRRYDNIQTMDEASQILGGRYSSWFISISPEEAFMAHCSNIQAFFENELNTDILHSDIAFPLLKKLVQIGYKPAESVFTAEIIKRYNEGTWKSRMFLKSEGYLKYLNKEEKRALTKDKNFEAFTDYRIPPILEREIDRKPFEKVIKTVKRLRGELIRVFEYSDIESDFKEIVREFPLRTLLNSDKILLFDDPERDKVWIWHGSNTTTRMKYYAKKLAPNVRERYGIGFKLTDVDEGIEPLEFKTMIKLGEEPYYKTIIKNYKRIYKNLEAQKLLSREKIQLLDFKLIGEGITKINSIMKKESVHELTIHRQYLQEIFDARLLEISNLDGFPIFKPGILECFELEGILTKIYGNVLMFFDVY